LSTVDRAIVESCGELAIDKTIAATRPGFLSIPSVFEQSVCEHAGKTAVEYGERAVSYQELRAAAAAIAARLPLVRRGQPRSRVALLFDDRIHAIAATFGVLAAGHAFVPVDAADPEERIRFILKDSEPIALLTDSEHAQRARHLAPAGCQLVDIQDGARKSGPDGIAELGPEDLAYIFYTSGSTGRPKGVCQTHRNLLFFVRSYCRTLGIREDDRLSLLYSLSFSAANMDIFGGLLSGATISAYDMRQHGIPGLAGWLDERDVTVLHAVPTIFRKLAAGMETGQRLKRIRAIDLGGEAVSVRDVELFGAHFPAGCLLVNHLAATEASVIAQHAVDRARNYGTATLPVGRCPEGVTVRIERADGIDAATGEAGRIIISSPYLSPGYWRRPELNAAAFCDDPSRPGWRIFRTDDHGSIGRDGELYFNGREGTRVKIRGQSVDLAEVEGGLRLCAGVRDAAVVTGQRENGPEADLLVAHLVMANGADRDAKRIRQELAGHLPHYMIPSAFAFPDALPMTATGKVDRRDLQQRPVHDAGPGDAASAPSDPLEKSIADVFSLILNRPSVGRMDDFYLLGGDSLLSVELQITLSEMMGCRVPLKSILEAPTVAGLAKALRQLQPPTKARSAINSILVFLQDQGAWPTLFLVHGKLGHTHVGPQFLQMLGEDQPVCAIQARGLEAGDRPNTTIAAMAKDYVAAIRTVQPEGPYFLGGLCAGGYAAIEMARLLREEGHAILPLLLIDPPPPPFIKDGESQRPQPVLVAAQFRERLAQSGITIDVNEAYRRQAAARRFLVASAFEKALLALDPSPYDGEAYLLSSERHLSPSGWGDPATLGRFFTSRLRIFEVDSKHDQFLDVQNRAFSEYLAQCLSRVRELAASSRLGRPAGS
jgi:amino acid adenylation domain-containing protein